MTVEHEHELEGLKAAGRLVARTLEAMGKALESTLLSMVREVAFGVGFALVLPVFMGLDGVLWSMPVSDILTFAVSLFLIARTWRSLGGGGGKARLQTE